MTEDKGNIIYEFLKRLNQTDDLVFAEINSIDINACYDGEIIDYIKENDLIRSKKGAFDYDALVYITKNGKNILEYDSWKEYIESIYNKEIEEVRIAKKRQEKQDEKLDLDIYLGKFEKKFGNKIKTWAFVITVINIVIVIGNVFISNQSNDKSNIQESDQILRIERKIELLNSRIEKLERKTDSLNHQLILKPEQPTSD